MHEKDDYPFMRVAAGQAPVEGQCSRCPETADEMMRTRHGLSRLNYHLNYRPDSTATAPIVHPADET
jgi:hypothetical protein